MAEINEVIITRLAAGPVKSFRVSFKPVIFKNFDHEVSLVAPSEQIPGRNVALSTYTGTFKKVNCSFLYPVLKDIDQVEELVSFFYSEDVTSIEDSAAGPTKTMVVVSDPVYNLIFEFGKFSAKPFVGTVNTFKYSYASPNTLGNLPRLIDGVVIPKYLELSFDINVADPQVKPGISDGRIMGTFLKS